MADQGQWFKLWTGFYDDPDIAQMSLEDIARWCILGVYIKKHGKKGSITFQKPAEVLQKILRLTTLNDTVSLLQKTPGLVTVSNETTVTVTFKNWYKYQGDYSTPRVYKHRENNRYRGEEKRGEEKRKEKEVQEKEKTHEVPEGGEPPPDPPPRQDNKETKKVKRGLPTVAELRKIYPGELEWGKHGN